MTEEKTVSGFILKIIPFRDFDRILTVFTKEQGLVRLIYKGKKQKERLSLSPLYKVDLLYQQGHSDLFVCLEIKILESYASLRSNWETLNAACDMTRCLLQSQYIHKPAPALFDLFEFYLNRIEASPVNVAISFRLKTLVHEGLIHPSLHCSSCQALLTSAVIGDGQPFCVEHAPSYGTHLQPQEWTDCLALMQCRQFSQIASLAATTCELKEKVSQIFDSSI